MTNDSTTGGGTPAGFYPDGSGSERYWDGKAWTDQYRPLAGPAAPVATAPPVKKSHTVRNILLGLLALVVLTFVGCAALVGGAVNEADKALQSEADDDAEPGGPENPLTIEEGKAFSVLGFDYAEGWKVSGGEFGGIDITGLRVTNNRDDKDGAIVQIKFMQGSEALAVVDCTTEQIPVGEATKVDCLTADDLPEAYDRITINDTF